MEDGGWRMEDGEDSVKIPHLVLALLRFSPWIYLSSLVLQILRLGLLMVPGPVIRSLFDTLSGGAGLTAPFWGLVALLVALALARIAALLGGIAVEFSGYFI